MVVKLSSKFKLIPHGSGRNQWLIIFLLVTFLAFKAVYNLLDLSRHFFKRCLVIIVR